MLALRINLHSQAGHERPRVQQYAKLEQTPAYLRRLIVLLPTWLPWRISAGENVGAPTHKAHGLGIGPVEHEERALESVHY